MTEWSFWDWLFGKRLTALEQVAKEVKNIQKVERHFTFEAELAEREIQKHQVKAKNLAAQIKDGMVQQQILGELRLAEQHRQRTQSYRTFAQKAAAVMTNMNLQKGEIQLHTAVVNASIALIRQSYKFHPTVMKNVIKDLTLSGDARQEMMSQLNDTINEQTEETLGGDEEASKVMDHTSVEDRAMAQLQQLKIEAGIPDVDALIAQMPTIRPAKKQAISAANEKK